MPNYGDKNYWEDRYDEQNGTTFDWLEDYNALKNFLNDLNLDKSKIQVLNMGCGNSLLAEEMYDDGYYNIKNIDIAPNVIETMAKKNENREGMTWEVMDIRDMKYEDCMFDLIIDKSTIDALLCGDNASINVATMLKEVQRVLKIGGYYMIISYGAPENRCNHLERKFLDFDVSIYTIKKSTNDDGIYDKVHYIYLCKKLAVLDEEFDREKEHPKNKKDFPKKDLKDKIKNKTDKINKFIPLIMGLLGIFLNVWLNDWSISPEIILGGLVSGLATTGLNEAGKHIGEMFDNGGDEDE